jgi:rod shape-determining protein MreC
MPRRLSGWRSRALQPWIALLTSVLFSLLLRATSSTRGNRLARERAATLLSLLARPFGIVPAVINLAGENARLRAENSRLRIKITDAEEAFKENRRLRRLLQFKQASTLNLKAAEVIATNPMQDVHSLLIDIGEEDGARQDQAVINDLGLVGKLVRVGKRTSVVQLLLDRNLGAAVRFMDCRVNGITNWAGGNVLFIENVPSSAPVHIGERVITSGLDGIFPENIPVGAVTGTKKVEHSLFLQVEVEPDVDFSLLEEVFVVLNRSSQPTSP